MKCHECKHYHNGSGSDPCGGCSGFRHFEPYDSQDAKYDSEKLDLTLVPRQIIWDIAEIRRYGTEKYGSPDNWKNVSIGRFRAAAFRHFMAYLEDPKGLDEESGLPNLSHLATNIAFLCELERNERKND